MQGTQLLLNDHGNPTSVIVDLSILGDNWEPIYEAMRAEAPAGGPTLPWEQVKTNLRAAEALRNSDAYLDDFDGEDECSDEPAAANQCIMKGVQYITDQHGNPTSVALDLATWSDVWEDIYDGMVLESRRIEEPTITLEDLKLEMKQEIFAND